MPAPSLSQHLFRIALLATLVPLLAMLGVGVWQYRDDVAKVERVTGQESLAAARVAANSLDFVAADALSALKLVRHAREGGVASPALLQFLVRETPSLESLAITDASGRLTLTTVPGERGTLAGTAHFQAIRAGAPVIFGSATRSPTLGKYILPIAMPYRQQGRFAGMVFARISTNRLSSLLASRLEQGEAGSTYVTDGAGRVIAHPDPSLAATARSFAERPPVRAAGAGQSGWMREDTQMAGYLKMPRTGWIVVSSRDPGELLTTPAERLRLLGGVVLLVSLMAGVAAYVGGKQLARPLETLSARMRAAQRAEFAEAPALHPRASSGVSEVEALTESFEALITELGERFTAQHAAALEAERQAAVSHAEALERQNVMLAALSEQAAAANKLKSEFLATMSHELRTPLNAIIGYTELTLMLESEPLSARTRDHLGRVARSARHLLALINDVLDLSKIEADRLEPERRPVALSALLQSVESAVEPQARAKGLALSFTREASLERIESDETRLHQIVLNLVANAVKFTETGAVSVRAEPRGDAHFAISVADTGVGIDPAHHALIFDAFRQVDASAARKAGGTGLGLAIARRLAVLLGGELTVESALGQGATFTLLLPRQLPASPSGEAA